jgi:diguanylate cyclase (GGDEF)-like protein
MDSLFPALFWGNVIAFMYLTVWHGKKAGMKEKYLSNLLILARFCHAFYYFVASGRGILPDLISVNMGNTLLFAGFYFEGRAILRVVKEDSKATDAALRAILAAAVIAFNAVELFAPMGGIRITMASAGVFALMFMPVLFMLISRHSGRYTRPSGVFYAFFMLGLIARAWYGVQDQTMDILTTNIIQSLTFLALLLQIIIALPSYTMIIKGYADEALILMATTDRLTGATNRHAFMDAAAIIFRNAVRAGQPISVLFLDVDNFKQINDTYGHAFGDAVLARLAALIDKSLRESDLSCRYGGEEFMILLPRADSAAAETVAKRIVDEVRGARFEEQPEFSFTVSIGISSRVPLSEQEMDDAFRSADKAMYRVKQAGRDGYAVNIGKSDIPLDIAR